MSKRYLAAMCVMVLFAASALFSAAAPSVISYQAFLADSNGDPVTTTVEIRYTLYDDAIAGGVLWAETLMVTPSADGMIAQVLGDVNPFDEAVLAGENRWLGVQVGTDTEMSPRTRMTSSPYSLRVRTIDQAAAGVIRGTVEIAPSSGGGDDAGLLIQNSLAENGLEISMNSDQPQLIVRGPGGDEEVIHSSTGSAYFSTTVKNPALAQKIVSIGSKGLIVLSESDPADTLINITQTATGPKIIVAGNQSKAFAPAVEITSDGVYVLANGGADTNIFLGNNGDVIGRGQIAMGQGSNWGAAKAVANWSTVFGFFNTASGDSSVVSGGWENTASGFSSVIGGGYRNTAAGDGSVISGGGFNTTYGVLSVVGGGTHNDISDQGGSATISGGQYNYADSVGAVVGGGQFDTASGNSSVVSGGYNNVASGRYSVVGGGLNNDATNSYTTIGGGGSNLASGVNATVAGGGGNIASGPRAVVGGGQQNVASGAESTIPGGWYNEATGPGTFAAGHAASAVNCGSIVFNAKCSPDSSNRMYSGADAQFVVHASNGLYFTNVLGTAPFGDATKLIQTSTGAYLTTSGTWTNSSDVNLKENFSELDSDELLYKIDNLSVTQWNYKVDGEDIIHIGPTAQDFHAAFGVGNDNVTIATVDADGVALAAVKALNERIKKLNAENQKMKASLEMNSLQYEQLKELVEKLLIAQNQTEQSNSNK